MSSVSFFHVLSPWHLHHRGRPFSDRCQPSLRQATHLQFPGAAVLKWEAPSHPLLEASLSTTVFLIFSLWSIFWKTLLDTQCLCSSPSPAQSLTWKLSICSDTSGACFYLVLSSSYLEHQCTQSGRHFRVSRQAAEWRVIVKVGRWGSQASPLRRTMSAAVPLLCPTYASYSPSSFHLKPSGTVRVSSANLHS